ncbi:MAG TPA: CoA pyrophosphatase [Solirubrobacteraceae bacterium]|nr:CoA pyrophosphatase [Solirubrobacteraceae bacterium]
MSSGFQPPAELAAALREVLLDPAQAAGLDVPGRIDAAVLVPLFLRDDRLHVVLTRRTSGLRSHAGEVSFPGGRQDDDETDLRLTALREAQEEIGLDPGAVELVGALAPTPTVVSNYAVYPFVGLIAPGTRWTLSAREVDEVLEPSIDELRAGFGRRSMVRRGIPFRTDVYALDGAVVWGATARMLGDLLERLERAGL